MSGDYLADLRIRVEPGPGAVASLRGVLLVVPTIEPGQEEALHALLKAATIRPVVRAVARVVADFEADQLPAFCLVVEAERDGGLFALVHGAVVLEADGGSSEVRLSGLEARSWVDRTLPAGLTRLSVRVPEGDGSGARDGGRLVLEATAAASPSAPPASPEVDTPKRDTPRPSESGRVVIPSPAPSGSAPAGPVKAPFSGAASSGGPSSGGPSSGGPASGSPASGSPSSGSPSSGTPAPAGRSSGGPGGGAHASAGAGGSSSVGFRPEPIRFGEGGRMEAVNGWHEPTPAPTPTAAPAPAKPEEPVPSASGPAVKVDARPAPEPAPAEERPGAKAADDAGAPGTVRTPELPDRSAPPTRPELLSRAEPAARPEPPAPPAPPAAPEPSAPPAPSGLPTRTPGLPTRTPGLPTRTPAPAAPSGPAVPVPPTGLPPVPPPAPDVPGGSGLPVRRPQANIPPQNVTQVVAPPRPGSFPGAVPPPVPAAFDPFGAAASAPRPPAAEAPREKPAPPPAAARGPRIGRLILDDGPDVVVDADCVIGRNPEVDVDVAQGRAKPVILPDAEQRISRVHARLVYSEAGVEIVDAGSVNGTWIEPPGGAGWIAMVPRVPSPLPLGSRIQVGDLVLSYAPLEGDR